MSELTILIPAHNEAARIGKTLDRLRRQLLDTNIIVVTNACQDDTARIAREHGATIVYDIEKPGKWRAIYAGLVLVPIKTRLVFLCDADLSFDFEGQFFSRFIGGHYFWDDLFIGSRQMVEAVRYNEPITRHIMGRVFNLCTQALIPETRGITDTQCGFKLFTGDMIPFMIELGQETGYCGDIEFIMLARLLGFRVKQIPITWYSEPGSKVRPWQDSRQMFIDLLRIRRRRSELLGVIENNGLHNNLSY